MSENEYAGAIPEIAGETKKKMSSPLKPETQEQLAAIIEHNQKILQGLEEGKKTQDSLTPPHAVHEGVNMGFDEPTNNYQFSNTGFDTPKFRKKVEANITDTLDLDDLIFRGYVKQNVPILPGKFEVEFQTITLEDNVHFESLISDRKKSNPDSDISVIWANAARIALYVNSINRKPLPPIKNRERNTFSKENLEKRTQTILSLPENLFGLVSVNLAWFNDRASKLTTNWSVDDLKNS